MSDDRARAPDCGAGTNVSHDDGCSTDPDIFGDGDGDEFPGMVDRARRAATVLVVSAQDLHAGSDLNAILEDDHAEDGVAPYVDASAHPCLRMGKEGAE